MVRAWDWQTSPGPASGPGGGVQACPEFAKAGFRVALLAGELVMLVGEVVSNYLFFAPGIIIGLFFDCTVGAGDHADGFQVIREVIMHRGGRQVAAGNTLTTKEDVFRGQIAREIAFSDDSR
jgi:hypothetical protein